MSHCSHHINGPMYEKYGTLLAGHVAGVSNAPVQHAELFDGFGSIRHADLHPRTTSEELNGPWRAVGQMAARSTAHADVGH
jgi:hypothetical protein